MKKLTLAVAAALALTGCASTPQPLVSEAAQQQMTQTNRLRLIDGCQNGRQREQWDVLELLEQWQAEGQLTADEFWTAAFNSCTGLTESQRDAYWVYVQKVRMFHEQLHNQLADTARMYREADRRDRWRRAAQGLQNSGRLMMEIQRTDDLDRIRRGLDDRGY